MVQGESHTTIRNYLNSLSTYGQLQGYSPLNLQNVFKIELSIAQPLSLTVLNNMVHHVEFDHSIQVAAWAAIVISFHLLLCKSNLVPNTTTEFKAAQQLQQCDIYFHWGMVLLNKMVQNQEDRQSSDCAITKGKRTGLSSHCVEEAVFNGFSLTI